MHYDFESDPECIEELVSMMGNIISVRVRSTARESDPKPLLTGTGGDNEQNNKKEKK